MVLGFVSLVYSGAISHRLIRVTCPQDLLGSNPIRPPRGGLVAASANMFMMQV